MGKIGNQGEELDNNQVTDYNNLIATPLARKVAHELRINLSQVCGSGPNGRVLYDDVLIFKRNRLSSRRPSGLRKTISSQLLGSQNDMATIRLMYIGDPGEKLDEESVVATQPTPTIQTIETTNEQKEEYKQDPA